MRKYSIFLLTICLALAVTVPANAIEQVTINGLIGTAKENNAAIIAARQRWNAARSKIAQERTWDKPKLSLEYLSVPEGTFNLGAAPERMYGISQMIPFPGKLFIKGKIAGSEADATRWEYRDTELMVLAELKSAYGMYYYINQSIDTYRQTVELMKSFAKSAEARYITGKAMQNEVLRAQVETEKMATMLVTLEQEYQSAKTEINQLIGKNADSPIGSPQEIVPNNSSPSWDEIKELAIKNRPELGRINTNLVKSQWAKRSSMMEYLPDFDISLKRKTMNDQWIGSDVMFGMDIPLWFWKQSSGVSQMSAELKAAESEKENVELMTVAKARDAFTKVESVKRLLDLYDTSVIPKSEQSLKVAQASYSAGRSSFLELLDSMRSYLELKLEYYKYIWEYQKNIAALERIAGIEFSDGGSK